jgi:outer membrane protein TolC
VEREAASPSLDIYGGTTFQGRAKESSKSIDDLNDNRKNVWNVGLSLQVPLDFGLVIDLKKAARLEEEAQLAKLKHQKFDYQTNWKNYQEELLRCGQSIRLLSQLEKSQQRRFFSEESKYKKGRSTLFQVLIAEQDFINAQTQKLGNELQCRVVSAQAALYLEEGKLL